LAKIFHVELFLAAGEVFYQESITIFVFTKPRLKSPASDSLKSSSMQIFLSVLESSMDLTLRNCASIVFLKGLNKYIITNIEKVNSKRSYLQTKNPR